MNLLRPTFHIISHIRDIVKLVAMRGGCDDRVTNALLVLAERGWREHKAYRR